MNLLLNMITNSLITDSHSNVVGGERERENKWIIMNNSGSRIAEELDGCACGSWGCRTTIMPPFQVLHDLTSTPPLASPGERGGATLTGHVTSANWSDEHVIPSLLEKCLKYSNLIGSIVIITRAIIFYLLPKRSIFWQKMSFFKTQNFALIKYQLIQSNMNQIFVT